MVEIPTLNLSANLWPPTELSCALRFSKMILYIGFNTAIYRPATKLAAVNVHRIPYIFCNKAIKMGTGK